eukprot:CAMPEP_0170190484 /NCGR_PEP_ID=MMETSP0040_2-20121228/49482_1 /TAXON_ID=641309 /ORGANISM="Lotharella oceanica, Strain CCMP622" /LENGTH=156 /DNA_ID=CAMNT_0010438357 /DNA_START=96 /DNA_END=562 /DNA_ORIENTATION=+
MIVRQASTMQTMRAITSARPSLDSLRIVLDADALRAPSAASGESKQSRASFPGLKRDYDTTHRVPPQVKCYPAPTAPAAAFPARSLPQLPQLSDGSSAPAKRRRVGEPPRSPSSSSKGGDDTKDPPGFMSLSVGASKDDAEPPPATEELKRWQSAG